ncbi:MAG: hypothetical protein M4D80_26750 [Myxococcota bacterium]|nr:hypothetical protein [Deltaproteobacteria bacterium]MDQ3338782.1 hypothetical protein [Myxococcota bacterium]
MRTYDGTVWVRFESQGELERAVAQLFRVVNLVEIDREGFRPKQDYVFRRYVCGKAVWLSLTAALARFIAHAARFGAALRYDPRNEWGPPIGYAIVELADGDRTLVVVVGEGTEHTAAVHPDDGAFEGAVAEIQRRERMETSPVKTLMFASWGDALDDDFLDRWLHYALVGVVDAWRPHGDGYQLQLLLDGGNHRVELDADDGAALADAYERCTGYPLAALDDPDAQILGGASRRLD